MNIHYKRVTSTGLEEANLERYTVKKFSFSLVPRPPPSFPLLAVRKSGRGPGTFPHVSDVMGRKAVERL